MRNLELINKEKNIYLVFLKNIQHVFLIVVWI